MGTCRSTRPLPTLSGFRKGGGSLSAQAGGGKSELHRARRRATPVQPGIRSGDWTARSVDGQCHREHTAELRSQDRGGKGEKVG